MDRKTQEEIKKTVESLQHEARAIDIHLAELPGALGTTTDWSKVWQVGFRAQADLRRLVPGVVALSQRMVKLAVAERTGSQTPGQLAELTRTVLTKYLDVHGGVYEAIYAQLRRGTMLAPDATERFSLADPEVADVCKRMESELFALSQGGAATPEALRLIDVLELAASALHLLCGDTPAAREQLATSLGTVLERHVADASTALELLVEA